MRGSGAMNMLACACLRGMLPAVEAQRASAADSQEMCFSAGVLERPADVFCLPKALVRMKSAKMRADCFSRSLGMLTAAKGARACCFSFSKTLTGIFLVDCGVSTDSNDCKG